MIQCPSCKSMDLVAGVYSKTIGAADTLFEGNIPALICSGCHADFPSAAAECKLRDAIATRLVRYGQATREAFGYIVQQLGMPVHQLAQLFSVSPGQIHAWGATEHPHYLTFAILSQLWLNAQEDPEPMDVTLTRLTARDKDSWPPIETEIVLEGPPLEQPESPCPNANASPPRPKNGAELIAEEREHQVVDLGYGSEIDHQWGTGELAMAASCYLLQDVPPTERRFPRWPWPTEQWKPRDRLSNLVRAGALVAAEIDRVLRLTPSAIRSGARVVRGPGWVPNEFDAWGRGKGIGIALCGPDEDGDVDVVWDTGRCIEKASGLQLAQSGEPKRPGFQVGDWVARADATRGIGKVIEIDSLNVYVEWPDRTSCEKPETLRLAPGFADGAGEAKP